jgi:peptidyl-prolyl cis-trans isomerase A (cyclophilin A)
MARWSNRLFRPLCLLPLLALAACGDEGAETTPPAEATKADGAVADADTKPGKSSTPPEAVPGRPGERPVKEAQSGPVATPLPQDAPAALTDPSLASEQAPASFKCHFETSKGAFVVEVTRAWAPVGADRFYNLCKVGWFDNAKFFRNIGGFMVQFGISAYPAATTAWKEATIHDDAVVESNTPLMVTFAKTGAPNSRTTQIFINHGNNKNLDGMGFAPFGKVVEGADVVGQLYDGYGEGAPRGKGPRQDLVMKVGDLYLEDRFPKLDKIVSTKVK